MYGGCNFVDGTGKLSLPIWFTFTSSKLFGISFARTILILIIALPWCSLCRNHPKKVSPALYQALGIFLPLITNRAVLGSCQKPRLKKDMNLLQSGIFLRHKG
ncbi:MAG: hypothetical protein H6540_02270 [Bacteroidales bacterium]|nr:hypothetical protein [Bacteroidales bacterium]